jgi:hypothetical protein
VTVTRAWRNVGFIGVAIVLVWCAIGAFDPPRLNWGDTSSDYNTMIAGRNFAKYGFTALRWTPHLLDTAAMYRGDSNMVYTHYPQLPEVMNGALRKVARFPDDVIPFRLFALTVSFGALFFVYGVIGMYWSRQAAQVALALWVTNPLWIQHADYLHHGPYGAFFGFGSLYFLARALRQNRRSFLVASGIFLFFAYCSSYDYWIFVPLLMAAIAAHHHRGLFRRDTIRVLSILAPFALAAIALKTALNIWGLGGLDRFLADLHFQSVERTTDTVVRTSFAAGMVPTLLGRIQRHFTLLLIPLVLFWATRPFWRKRVGDIWSGVTAVNPIAALLAALPFLIVFRELWVGQYYPFLMIVPFYAIGFAAVIAALVASAARPQRIVGYALLVALLANAAFETLSFRKAFFDRESIRQLRTRVDALAPPGQWLMVNHVFESFYRYYFDRNAVALIVHRPNRIAYTMGYFSDPADPRFAGATGSVFVQHKRVADAMFDKGYYYLLAADRRWNEWGDPSRHRAFLDRYVAERDSTMGSVARTVGHKIEETDSYVLWSLPPSKPMPAPRPVLDRYRHP